MKIHYSTKNSVPKFNLDNWLSENESKMNKTHPENTKWLYDHYDEVLNDFRAFLETKETVIDTDGKSLTPVEIYNAIEYYKIRIEKLWLMFKLKLYETTNVNKETKVRYIVMRAFWIDEKGKPFRKFSKNLGAENKVKVRGQIPSSDIKAVKDYIFMLMKELYYFEYINNDFKYIKDEDFDS